MGTFGSTSGPFRKNIDMYHSIPIERRIGFLRSSNKGMKIGGSEYIVVLNSDTIVTPGWLSKMIRCASSDPRIASVNPLTNFAANIDLAIAPGANIFGMNELASSRSRAQYPDIVTGVGFCMLLRRAILEKIGYFDEIYDRGYCEESDLCMRLTTDGYRTVVCDDTFVYHKGRASFFSRDERFKRNIAIFNGRWKKEYRKQYKLFLKNDPLRYIRTEAGYPSRFNLDYAVRIVGRKVRRELRKREWGTSARELYRGIRSLSSYRQPAIRKEFLSRVTRPDRLRVTYLLHRMILAGGVLSVVQLVNELILHGVEARIATLFKYPELDDWKMLFEPIVYTSEKELLEEFPPTDIVVATLWNTAYWVPELLKKNPSMIPVYFIQDYESWFYPEEEIEKRKAVINSYALIPNKIVKSDWLKAMLACHDYNTNKIRLGMDLGFFYPRESEKKDCPAVMAMARPRTPKRGYNNVIETFRRVKTAIPQAQIIFFGDENLPKSEIPFEFVNAGVVSNQDRLAMLYSQADVFFDGSDFQGFGRPALEAMACGAACVVTDVGGVNEYARHMENSIMVPPKNPDVAAEAIIRLIRNSTLRNRIRTNGIETAKAFCHKREGRQTYGYFMSLFKANGPSGER